MLAYADRDTHHALRNFLSRRLPSSYSSSEVFRAFFLCLSLLGGPCLVGTNTVLRYIDLARVYIILFNSLKRKHTQRYNLDRVISSPVQPNPVPSPQHDPPVYSLTTENSSGVVVRLVPCALVLSYNSHCFVT